MAIRFLSLTFLPAGINSSFAIKNKGFIGLYFIGEISGASDEISGSSKRSFPERSNSINHWGAITQISSAFIPFPSSFFISSAILDAKSV